MNRLLALACILAVLTATLGAAGCGDKTKTVTGTSAGGQTTTRTVPDVRLAETKFVLHTGLALGAFRRWIYRPWKAGTFKRGADGRVKALAKGAVAGAFTVKELESARNAALSDDRLRGLGDSMTKLIGQAQGLLPGLRSGTPSAGSIASLASGFEGITGLASQRGVIVREYSAPLPTG